MEISVKKLKEGARVPTYGSASAAGADLYACLDGDVTVPAGGTVFIGTGIAVAVPEGYAGFVYARSGLASKSGLAPANKVGVIDADYRGEVTVALFNHSGEDRVVSDGDRIAQLVVAPCAAADFRVTDSLPETERGAGGFGSTGKN